MSSPSDSPAQLARFPVEVREAYARVRATGDAAALNVIVHAALRDYMPRHSLLSKDAVFRDDLRLIDDLGFDSLAITETVFFFEDLFRVTIHNQDLMGIRTVGELRGFVERRLAEQRDTP